MQFLKGQSDIVAVVIIVLLAIALLGVAYTFGLPLINKNQDQAIGNRVEAFFAQSNTNSLPAKARSVANSGGKDSAVLDVSGFTRLYPGTYVGVENNSVEFGFQSTITSKAEDVGWVSVSGGACPQSGGTSPGIIGQDEPTVVCARADRTSGGMYNITYRVYFRELEDAQKKNGFLINLLQHPASSLTSAGAKSTVRLEFGETRQTTVGAKTLIITDMKVLLV